MNFIVKVNLSVAWKFSKDAGLRVGLKAPKLLGIIAEDYLKNKKF
jgi:hypothetical protein